MNRMLRKALTLSGAASLVLALALVPSGAANNGSGCALQGSATFTSGLTLTSKTTPYSFSGGLSNCQSTVAGSPATGTVTAGKKLTFAGVQYQEPVPSLTGSCANSSSSGKALIQWSDGTNTVLSYSTAGAGPLVALQGSVIASITLTAGTANKVINTNRYTGMNAIGLLGFQPPDPTACNSSGGVTSAGISGFAALEG